jgi:hypothetical protein
MKATRTSFNARASRMNLSYFSYKTGTQSMNVERTIPETEMKMAKPDRPEGPTCQCAWKPATLAKQAMARKLKKIWPV